MYTHYRILNIRTNLIILNKLFKIITRQLTQFPTIKLKRFIHKTNFIQHFRNINPCLLVPPITGHPVYYLFAEK